MKEFPSQQLSVLAYSDSHKEAYTIKCQKNKPAHSSILSQNLHYSFRDHKQMHSNGFTVNRHSNFTSNFSWQKMHSHGFSVNTLMADTLFQSYASAFQSYEQPHCTYLPVRHQPKANGSENHDSKPPKQ